ncbi:MAG: hypothetical protein K6T80_06240 [Firmicutes bacterium]|nr:hypothetical protein [Bacillota bacterium]
MSVCPLCNGLYELNQTCASCGGPFIDRGALQDFYDDYSAYLDQALYEDGYRCNRDEYCVHLFACPRCHVDKTFVFRRLDESELFCGNGAQLHNINTIPGEKIEGGFH